MKDLDGKIIIQINGSMVAIDTDGDIVQQLTSHIVDQWAKQYSDEILRDLGKILGIHKELNELESE